MNPYRPPSYVSRFRDALGAVTLTHIELPITRPPVIAHRGILTTSKIQYNESRRNLLGRQHEYTFLVDDGRIELSMQLYLNETNHWRLFSYCRSGMLLSFNLTLLRGTRSSFVVSQRLRLTTRGVSKAERAKRTAQLCASLTRLGLEVDRSARLILGTFDASAGRFIDTTPQAFIRDFALAALIKGHFMGNKGYRLPGLLGVSTTWTPIARSKVTGRAIPLGLRYQVLERAKGRCALCGRGLWNGVRLHVDHVQPYSQGGRTELKNLQALCQEDNCGKGNRSSRRFGVI